MLKKVLLVTALLVVIAVLVVGAINRTNDKVTTTQVGRGPVLTAPVLPESPTASLSAPSYGQGQGQAQGQGQTTQPYTSQVAAGNPVTIEGTVVSVDNLAMTVKTATGQQVLVQNRPWQYALQLQFSATVGDQIKMAGYDQNGYFVAAQLQNLTTGKSVSLRDDAGLPGWSGRGSGQRR